MKKMLTVLLSGALALTMTAPVFGAQKVPNRGSYQTRMKIDGGSDFVMFSFADPDRIGGRTGYGNVTLNVTKGGKMTVKFRRANANFDAVYPGIPAQAETAAHLITPREEKISDQASLFSFQIPVTALEKEQDISARSARKQTWYPHVIWVESPLPGRVSSKSLKVKNLKRAKVKVTWKKAKKAKKYQVTWKVGKKSYKKTTSKTALTISKGLKKHKKVKVTVYAVNAAGKSAGSTKTKTVDGK